MVPMVDKCVYASAAVTVGSCGAASVGHITRHSCIGSGCPCHVPCSHGRSGTLYVSSGQQAGKILLKLLMSHNEIIYRFSVKWQFIGYYVKS